MIARTPNIIICGYERGGTTLLSEVFRQNGFLSGFEVGVLMCESPEEFEDYYPYNKNMLALWDNLDAESFHKACSKKSYEEFYDCVFKTTFPNSRPMDSFYDKTPIYMSELGKVLHRTDFIEKAMVITRDPRSVFVSWVKRQVARDDIESYIHKNIDALTRRYLKYFIGCIAHRNNPAVKFVSFESLCVDLDGHLQSLGEFTIGKPWDNFGSQPKYSNVTSNEINLDKLNDYRKYIGIETEKLILNKTKLASLFFSPLEDKEDYRDTWISIENNIKDVLKKYNIEERSLLIDGVYFEPETYLLRYRDVLRSKVNPIAHFKSSGIKENRKPY